MERIERRGFLKRSSAAAAASLIGTSGAWAGANERIRLAIIGCGGHGRDHMQNVAKMPGVEAATVCDPDERRVAQAASELENMTGKKPATTPDLRTIMDDKNIDAVMIATANHWHALASIYASQAGKHSYVEKPVMHDMFEGRKMIEAARKYDRIVQGGTQRRSFGKFRKAMKLLNDGLLGDIYLSRFVLTGARESIGFKPPIEPPAWLRWDLWRGPAKPQPYHENLVHYNWHWFWDFGNGEMGNNGSHLIDVCRWGMGKKTHPVKIKSVGGRFGYKDQAETPNTQTATFEYEDGALLTCEIRNLYTTEDSTWHFYGTKGYMALEENAFRIYLGRSKEPIKEPDVEGVEQKDHARVWLDALRAGDRNRLTAEIEETYLSCALCELANLSYRVGRELRFDPKAEKFVGDSEADKLLRREPVAPFAVAEKV
jgi:predicted dehydrogenase